MRVLRLRAQNFRLLADLHIELHPRLNVFIGDNAAGKSTVLDALYTAAHGRPYGGIFEDASGPLASAWSVNVVGRRADDRPESVIDVRYARRRHQQRIDGQDCRRVELARLLPLALLNPRSHALVGEGPAQRRRYLDWGMFHVEHGFIDVWRRGRRALKQRNAVLRAGGHRALLRPWNEELAAAAEQLVELRSRYLDEIHGELMSTLDDLVGPGPWTLALYPGWDAGTTLLEQLEAGEADDRRVGTTLRGPHRSELLIRRGDEAARRRVSRGEEKLLAAALVLAQIHLIQTRNAEQCVLLIDDFASELGAAAQRRLLQALVTSGAQLWVTNIERNPILDERSERAMFHVEHGAVTRVVN